jgi:hypothetical protein
MKLRFFWLTLATGAIALLLVTVTSLFWILAQSPLSLLSGGVNNYSQGTVFVAKTAPAMVSLLVNPEQLGDLGQLATPLAQRRRSQKEWKDWATNLLAKTGLKYRSEIRPWLGKEITLAITALDYDRNPDNGIQPGYLLATKTKNSQLAQSFLESSYKGNLVFEQYKGVKIAYPRPRKLKKSSANIWASAVVGDFVLFANYPQVLREAINNAQAIALNLNHSSSYQKALTTIKEPRIGLAYLNLPATSAWVAKESVAKIATSEQILAVSLSLQANALAIKTNLIGATNEQKPALNSPVTALASVPSESILTAAGVDLDGFWQQMMAGLVPESPLTQFINQVIAAIEEPLGIDLQKDIFAWVKEEYVFSLIPNDNNNKFDWLLIAQKSPDVEIETAIAHLDALAQQQNLTVNNLTIDNTKVTAWTKLPTGKGENQDSLDPEVIGAHASTDNYQLLASSVEIIAQGLKPNTNSLLESKGFKNAIASLPTDNDGYLYINWEKGKSIFEQKLPIIRIIELSTQSLFRHLRSLTITSQGSENGILRVTVLVNLKA